ncbi:hypothetical protein [Motiliproteus sediminis]|uniref:hypothetical protein n=1 Tax=Motiliproteus sediminis TaxID=1468178 RepID=UPI001AEFC83B|nr:hypothetical protein [Motiliproteus sediminis]
MNFRILLALLGSIVAIPVAAAEVSTIVSCKRDGEFWLCAGWRQGQVEVFRSETYITQVEFDAETQATLQAAIDGHAAGRTAEPMAAAPSYTLQLFACRSQACIDASGLSQVPASRQVEIVRGGQHWYVLAVGEYPSVKRAQQAAAELMLTYKLREKPWIRTLDSLERQRLKP